MTTDISSAQQYYLTKAHKMAAENYAGPEKADEFMISVHADTDGQLDDDKSPRDMILQSERGAQRVLYYLINNKPRHA